ncbi:unnamed protein product [Phaeothamnion confervicola]
MSSMEPESVDPKNARYPYCVVWSPLPLITWFLPFIGHMGIADSSGVIHDFAGSYMIGEDHMAFGAATRYVQLHPARCSADSWDEAVAKADDVYRKRIHNICCDNCHSHVALALNRMGYGGSSRWDMAKLCAWLFFRGRFVSVGGFLRQWVPIVVILVGLCVFT